MKFASSLKGQTVNVSLKKGARIDYAGNPTPQGVSEYGSLTQYKVGTAWTIVPLTNSSQSNPQTADLPLPYSDKDISFNTYKNGELVKTYTIHIVFE